MDMERYAQELMRGENGEALRALTQSEAGARLAARFDGAAVERAAREGDSKALSALLQRVLSTPEGRQFAAELQKTVGRDGR